MKVVVDWDGTVTEEDTLTMVLEHFGQRELYDRAEEGLQRGELTLHECIELEFSGMTAPLDEAVAFLVEHARVRPGFRELVERFDVVVLSSSFEETIRPALEREDVDVPLVANRVSVTADGWRPIWRDDAACATCGEACKRAALPVDGAPVVYVGDGYSDRCAAAAADRVFARDGLAEYLRGRGVPFEPFTDFHAVAAALLERAA